MTPTAVSVPLSRANFVALFLAAAGEVREATQLVRDLRYAEYDEELNLQAKARLVRGVA